MPVRINTKLVILIDKIVKKNSFSFHKIFFTNFGFMASSAGLSKRGARSKLFKRALDLLWILKYKVVKKTIQYSILNTFICHL